ncbi:MAG: anion permease [Chloroflexi bacterium]|nr:anion permease [Chloroflexota bacterium]
MPLGAPLHFGLVAISQGVPSTIDAARALAATPLFSGLSAVDLARLVPELDELEFGAGDAVFRQGDVSDGLYLIRDGSVGVSLGAAHQQRIVAVLEAPAYFGEMALLSDAPRSASILALRSLRVWRLPRDRFDRLVERQPLILRHAAAEVTRRLSDTTRRLSMSQESLSAIAAVAFGSLDRSAQRIVQAAAVANVEVDAGLLAQALGDEWSAGSFAWLIRESGFFQETPQGRWRLAYEGLRPAALTRLEADLGTAGRRLFEQHMLVALIQTDTAPSEAVLGLAVALEDWASVEVVALRHGATLLTTAPDGLEAALRTLPPSNLWARGELAALLAAACAAQGRLDQAEDVEREAAANGVRLATRPQRSASANRDGLTVRMPQSVQARLRRMGSRALGKAAATRPLRDLPWSVVLRRVLAAAMVVAFLVLALGAPPSGLSPAGYRVLLGIVLTLLLGLLDILPDYLLAVLVIGAWAASDTVPISVAASGLASPAWFLLLGAFGIGVAVTRSGILFRIAVELTRRLPPNHAVRCVALAFLGLLFTAGMPSTSGRLAQASPLAQDIADALRLPHRGPGAAALALSVFVGFGQMGTLFLTGSSATLVAYGLLPVAVQDQFSWGTWLLAALPAHIVLFARTMLFILIRFHTQPAPVSSRETLRMQRDILGTPSREEVLVLAVVSMLLVGFVTEPWHGVNPAWLALGALGILLVAGVVDDASLWSGVNWSLLLYLGMVLGFGQVLPAVGLDAWLAGRLDGLTDLVGDSQTLFIIMVALASMAAGLILRAGPSSAVLCLVLFPLGVSLAINPWVVALAVLMATNLWLHPQQSVYYLVAYYGAGERGFTHDQARPLAFAYALFVLVAVVASIPYWRWLGLIA